MPRLYPMVLNVWLWVAWWVYWTVAGLFVQSNKAKETIPQRLQHMVPFWIGAYLIFHGRHPSFFGRLYENAGVEVLGVAVTVAGIGFSVWARIALGRFWSGVITLKQGHRLIRTGPYEFVRHPIYTGLLTGLLGTAATASTVDAFLGFALISGAFLVKIWREERLLLAEFGGEYQHFKKSVPALLPLGLVKLLIPERRRDSDIRSEAFRDATLKSEQYRIVGLLLVFAALAAVAIPDTIANPRQASRFVVYLTFWVCCAVYEIGILILVVRSRQKHRAVRPWVWVLNTILECSFPTVALLGLTADKSYIGPYRALVSSTVLIYCFFIILSTLRLSALLCIVAGLASAGGYAGLFLFTLHVAPNNANRNIMPLRTFILYPVMLFGAGVIAAAVAHQIRNHVIAALAEAETRRKLDRVEYDLNTARSIQMGLLPKSPPAVMGYDIAGWSQPADHTGGDYYDWVELPAGRVLLTIADATGHGIGPALLVAACRSYFRAMAAHDEPLERMMERVDALLTADVPPGRFITAAVALLDSATDQLTLYSAGHGPTYYYSAASGQIRSFDADQPPLGIQYVTADACARVVQLAAGDCLVMVTDGFFECANSAGEMLGTTRLAEVVCANQSLTARDLIRAIHEHVLEFSKGTPQADDMTAVVIKRC